MKIQDFKDAKGVWAMPEGSQQTHCFDSYKRVWLQHRGRASDKWNHYLDFYDRLLPSLPKKHCTLLEIGVQNGGDLEVWRQVLGSDATVLGIDIDPNCALDFDGVITGDATDLVFLDSALGTRTFDVIIDDGSHYDMDILITLLNLWPRLNPGGIYVIEDLHAPYQEMEGPPSVVGLIFEALHHHWRIDHTQLDEVGMPGPLRLDGVEHMILEDSLAAIRKVMDTKSRPVRWMTGSRFPVVPREHQGLFTDITVDLPN